MNQVPQQDLAQNPNATAFCACFTGYSGINCGNAPLSDTLLVATVTAGAIAGIIIGILLFFGLSGAGTYAVYTKMSGDDVGATMNNPLYTGTGAAGTNPLHKQT